MTKSPAQAKGAPAWVWAPLLSLLVFSPCLLTGRAYFDSDLLAQFGPWRAFLKQELALGRFPLWDPYLLGGQPFLADLQNMMLYPPNYLTLPFSVPLGLTLFIALHWAWAAWGMDAWLRALGLGPRASRIGALTFALSGFFWMELIHPPVLAAFAWLPWWFARLEKLSRDPSPRSAFWAGLVFALLFLCGSFQVALGAFYGGLCYFGLRLIQNRPKKIRAGAVLRVFFFFLAGSLPLGGQFIPSLEFFSLSHRQTETQDYQNFNALYSLNPATLDHALFPALRLSEGVKMDHAVQNDRDFLANILYLGIWMPVLAAFAFRKKGNNPFPLSWFLLSTALLTLTVCFGGYFFLHAWTTRWVPGFADLRAPYRFSYFWAFSLAALAAAGWRSLEALSQNAKTSPVWVWAAAGYGLAALGVSAWEPARTLWEMSALLLGFLGAGWALREKNKALGLGLWEAALLLPLLLRGWEVFMPAPASNFDFAANSRAVTALSAPLAPARVMLDPRRVPYPIQVGGLRYVSFYPENAFAALRLKDFGGYNPLSLRAVDDLRYIPSDKIFKLMAIGGFLVGEDAGPLPGFEEKTDTFLHLYVSRFSGRLAFAPRSWQVLEKSSDQLQALQNPGFDPYQQGLLSQALSPADASRLTGKPAQLQYQLLRDAPSSQSFQLNLAQDSLVVFCEVAYPGWRAQLDGHPAQWFTADHALRAVLVPAGSHRVDFDYRPWWKGWIFLPWLLTASTGFWLFGRPRKAR